LFLDKREASSVGGSLPLVILAGAGGQPTFLPAQLGASAAGGFRQGDLSSKPAVPGSPRLRLLDGASTFE